MKNGARTPRIKVKNQLFLTIILVSTIIICSPAAGTSEDIQTSTSSGITMLTWNFDKNDNYIMNDTILEDGQVQLARDGFIWVQNNSIDFISGETDNITITDDGELALQAFDEKIIDVNTERHKTFKINIEHMGYQTFKTVNSFILSKIMITARVYNEVDEDLNISVSTMTGKVITKISLPPSEFSYERSSIFIRMNCSLEAETNYKLVFESSSTRGWYGLIGEDDSVYPDGYFKKISKSSDDRGSNESCNGHLPAEEESDSEIEFEIFAQEYSSSGQFTSKIFTTNEPVFWKKIIWRYRYSSEPDIEIQIRCGNSSNPFDGSWTRWVIVNDQKQSYNGTGLPISSSTHIQYKVKISTDNKNITPILSSIIIKYEKYKLAGTIETKDYQITNSTKWSNFSAVFIILDKDAEYYYSRDSGKKWYPIESLYSINVSDKIRFLIKIYAINSIITPILTEFSIEYKLTDTLVIPDTPKEASNDGRDTPPIVVPPETIYTAGISFTLLSLLGYGLGTETGKYSLIKGSLFFLIPLYHKVDRDKILDHYLRNQIYKYIKTNPGCNYSEIMKDTGIKNGVMVHHLNTLDREDLIKSVRDGMFRRFYPIGTKIPQKEIDDLSWFQIRIFNYIRIHPGTTPLEIAEEVGKSKQVINYHLKLMKHAELIRAEAQGKNTQLYIIYNELNTPHTF